MSATSVVEKATSDMLIGPDWALNLDLCDAINNDPSQAKEVVKAVKKRITNKSPQVQLLALTVLETLIKNCGDHVHQQVAESNVLAKVVKLVKKKADMRVRDKTLVLLDSWQEAFGGSNGRYPQYYMAYNELLKAGVEFPRRGGEPQVPIFTPQSQPISSLRPPPHGPEDTANVSGMSLADIKNAQNLAELCNDMVSALNPRDRMSAKEEVIVEIVDQCRILQRRVMQLVNDTSDEELLRQGLSLNDDLQRVLARYDAFVSGAPLPETRAESKVQPQKALVEDPSVLSPKVQTPPAAQSSPSSSIRPKGSARTIFPTLPLPPPPSSKRPVTTQSSSVRPGDAATLDLLSGDLPSPSSQSETSPSALALTVMDPPPQQKQQQQVDQLPQQQKQQQVDFLALPAPEDDFQNPFDSSPFQATPRTEAVSRPVPPPAQSLGLQAEPQAVLHLESVSGQPVQSPPQYNTSYNPVTATPPPWQEDDTRTAPPPPPPPPPPPQADQQQWQQGGSPQTWNSSQQQGMGVGVQHYPGAAGYTGSSSPSPLQSRMGSGPGDNFGSLYMQQRGSAYGQSSSSFGGRSSSQQQPQAAASKPSLKSPDMLFNDLVDLRSVNAKFKAASLALKVQAPNNSTTSKADP